MKKNSKFQEDFFKSYIILYSIQNNKFHERKEEIIPNIDNNLFIPNGIFFYTVETSHWLKERMIKIYL